MITAVCEAKVIDADPKPTSPPSLTPIPPPIRDSTISCRRDQSSWTRVGTH